MNSTSVNTYNVTITGPISWPNIEITNTSNLNHVNIIGTPTFKNEMVVDVAANTNIGSNASAVVVYSFNKATYSSAKLTVQAKNNGNTQISEVLIAHDGTDAYSTMYGTISSPPSGSADALLGTYTASINSTAGTVELFMNQTRSNTAVKVVAHLIK